MGIITNSTQNIGLQLYATGTYNTTEKCFTFDKVKANQNYIILFESSLRNSTIFSIPITITEQISYGTSMSLMPNSSIGLISITPFCTFADSKLILTMNAFVLTGDNAGTDIADQLLPTITSLKLYTI
nr:MAG TPA: hypothetical protein [Caudoviricetes sp.]